MLETEETASLLKPNLSYIRCMIISLSSENTESQVPTRIYFCTQLEFNRIMEELECMDIDSLMDEEGVVGTQVQEPFMLNHIYLN